MAESSAREKLVDLLDRKVFRPILDASPDRYSGADRERFEDVREKTERTREKYRKEYGSAEKVYEMYRNDLSSEPAQRVTHDSHRLDLPALEDVKDEFAELARDVGVGDSGR